MNPDSLDSKPNGEFYGQRSLAGYSPWGTKNWTRLTREREKPGGKIKLGVWD